MSFFGSILLLAGLVSAVMSPLYFGRGLSESDPARMLTALGFAVAAAILFFLFTRSQRGRVEEQRTEH